MSDAQGSETYVVRRGGVRLDRFLAEAAKCGRRTARRAIADGRVRIDGRLARSADKPDPGSTVTLAPSPGMARGASSCTPDDEPRILWEADGLLVLAKPAGFHTHAGDRLPSVAAWLATERPSLRSIGERGVECGIAHRLDRDTSGVLLAAADAATYLELREWFASHSITKWYLALTAGRWDRPEVVDRPLARRRTRVVAATRRDRSWQARTAFRALSCSPEWTLVEARMRTGVTHQVRAHAAFAGHPLFGDAKYEGPPAPPTGRGGALLHASRVALPDGRAFTAPAPADFLGALADLRRRRESVD